MWLPFFLAYFSETPAFVKIYHECFKTGCTRSAEADGVASSAPEENLKISCL